jgi:hypothetical protein
VKNQFLKTMLDVEDILAKHKGARDSDRALVLEFLFSKTSLKKLSKEMKLKIAKAIYCEMPAFETITRCRRRIQATGKLNGSMKTQSLRMKKAKLMRELMR